MPFLLPALKDVQNHVLGLVKVKKNQGKVFSVKVSKGTGEYLL